MRASTPLDKTTSVPSWKALSVGSTGMSTHFGEVPFLMNIRVEQCWSAQWLSLHPIPLFTSLTPRAGMVTCPPLFYAAHLLPRRHHQLLLLHPLPLLLLLIGIMFPRRPQRSDLVVHCHLLQVAIIMLEIMVKMAISSANSFVMSWWMWPSMSVGSRTVYTSCVLFPSRRRE